MQTSDLPDCLGAAITRTLTGVFYLAVYQLGCIYFPDDYLISEQFQVITCSIFLEHGQTIYANNM